MTSAGREGEMFFTAWSGKPLCRHELELKPSGLKTKPKTHQPGADGSEGSFRRREIAQHCELQQECQSGQSLIDKESARLGM